MRFTYYICLVFLAFIVSCCTNGGKKNVSADGDSVGKANKVEKVERGKKVGKVKKDKRWMEYGGRGVVPESLIDCSEADRRQIGMWLAEAKSLGDTTNLTLFFSQKFLGMPYKGTYIKTNKRRGELLGINVRFVDCTTYVETVLALSLAAARKDFTFQGFCRYLCAIRYAGNRNPEWKDRNHYFSAWVEENTRNGLVRETALPEGLSVREKKEIDYITTHPKEYPQTVRDRDAWNRLREIEKRLSSRAVRYIPKDKFAAADEKRLRSIFRDGDIIVIVTNKRGLDVQHVGFATWRKTGLYMRHSSSDRNRVIDEKRTLQEYLRRVRTSRGVRVLRMP
ncbi:MAG: DUF1460 domain-containing protein [Bacteroidaceae bacterium]|nr:DUF1460 domain-containing protein [Bacteroidaceae bacterium]